MLSRGTFRDLYVYGYDHPEGYVIEKDGHLYYAFYVPSPLGAGWKSSSRDWTGELELRGLGPGEYKVVDYVNGKDYGTVSGPIGKLNAHFNNSLLLEASPIIPR